MRTLGIVFGGPPGGITGFEDRTRDLARCWREGTSVDWVIGAGTRLEAQTLAADWPARAGGRVLVLEPPARDPHPRWRRWRGGHDKPRQPESVPPILGPFDATVPRHQVAKALRDEDYDVVWCADPVAMAHVGKVRRDLPVVLDVPAPVDASARSGPVRDPDGWHRFEQHIAASAHMVTVPTAAARELLGVPGALVLDPAVPGDGAAFLDAVVDVCRWSQAFHGMHGTHGTHGTHGMHG